MEAYFSDLHMLFASHKNNTNAHIVLALEPYIQLGHYSIFGISTDSVMLTHILRSY